MKIWYSAFLLSFISDVQAQKLSLLHSKKVTHFPSASAIEYHNDRLYVFGDDAPYLLILDKNYKPVDSVLIFDGAARIRKNKKADLEAVAVRRTEEKPLIVAVSSFSTPERNKIFYSASPGEKKLKTINYNKVRKELRKHGIEEINIEGATFVQQRLVLSNRANNSHRTNYLISLSFNEDQEPSVEWVRPVDLRNDKEVKGLSGLTYLPQKDMLLFTASVEHTSNSFADGSIGDSYIGYITDFSKRKFTGTIVPDKLLNLSRELKLKGDNKIESVAVESASKKQVILHLAADNDNGESAFYKVRLHF